MIDGLDGIPSGSASPSLESHLGAMLDGFSGAAPDPTPDPASPDTGAQPAAGESAGPEATPAEASVPATPAEPAQTGTQPAPAAPDPAATPSDDDPFKDATPLTYTVNGQERQADYIKLLGAHGAVIEAKDLPTLQAQLSERSVLYERDQQTRQQLAEYERLTEWTAGKDAQGQDIVLRGTQGIEASRVATAKALASLNTLGQALKANPAKFLLWGQDAEGNATVAWDPDKIDALITQSELMEMRAEQAVRNHFATSVQTVRQSATQQQEDAQLPTKLWAAADAAWVSQHPELTPADKTFLQSQMPRYVRAAQKGEESLGRVVLDPSFYEVIADRAALRKASAEQVKATAEASSRAAKENAAKLQAAAIGKPKQPPVPATPVKPVTPASSRESDAADAWDLQEQAAARMVRQKSSA